MAEFTATNAASSGVTMDRKMLKELTRRADAPGLVYLAQWGGFLLATGSLVWASIGTAWVWPAMALFGTFMTVPAYALSHECAHGTAFRTRWLNELVLWVTSLIYIEEPLHRRFTHTNHHSYTWHVGKDSQMPFDTPMAFAGWLAEITGLALLKFHLSTLVLIAAGRPAPMVVFATPETELPKLIRNARVFLLIYASLAGLVLAGQMWPVWFLLLPRLMGAPVMLLFTLIQHVELQENSPSILESTRSFRTNWLGRFLYANMNFHVEHHLYPQVPFHALPRLNAEIAPQLPEPDPGFFRTNLEVISVVFRRSLGRGTKAASIRQAPHMITIGGPVERIAERSM